MHFFCDSTIEDKRFHWPWKYLTVSLFQPFSNGHKKIRGTQLYLAQSHSFKLDEHCINGFWHIGNLANLKSTEE